LEKSVFANTLYPQSFTLFEDTLSIFANIPVLIETQKSLSILYIDCEMDFENIIYIAISSLLSSQRFPITKEMSQAVYICKITVNENKEIKDIGVFYHPSINIQINNKKDVLFTYNTSINKIGAFNADIARRRSYIALSKEIQNSFLLEIRGNFE
jgi:hypothetical protein